MYWVSQITGELQESIPGIVKVVISDKKLCGFWNLRWKLHK